MSRWIHLSTSPKQKSRLPLKSIYSNVKKSVLNQRGTQKKMFEYILCACVCVPPRGRRNSSPPRSFFRRVLWAAVPFHLLLLFLLLLPCLVPQSERDSSCTVANNFARSFHPMLHYTNGPPPTWERLEHGCGGGFKTRMNKCNSLFFPKHWRLYFNWHHNDEVVVFQTNISTFFYK